MSGLNAMPSWLRRASPLGPKIAVLALAVLLWFHFAVDEEAVIEYQVNPRLQNLPPNLELVTGGTPVPPVLIQLQGPISTLRNISSQDIDLRVDLSRAGKGSMNIPIDSSSAHLPFGTRIVKLSPSLYPVKLNEIESRKKTGDSSR